MGRAGRNLAANNVVHLQGAVQAAPQVGVFYRNHFALTFPMPVVGPPVVEAVFDAAADVIAGGLQRYMSGLIDRLQAADNCEQFQPFAMYGWFGVFHFDLRSAIGGMQGKVPIAGAVEAVTIGPEQKVRCESRHAESAG